MPDFLNHINYNCFIQVRLLHKKKIESAFLYYDLFNIKYAAKVLFF